MNIPFDQFIKIDRRKVDAIYLQIVYQFITAVKNGILTEGYKIPGSRVLSKELKVHRKTVVAALEELQAQGWVVSRASVGTFIKNPERKIKGEKSAFNTNIAKEKAGFEFRKNFILDPPLPQQESPFYFTAGTPDYRWIKTIELSRFYAAALRRQNVIKKISRNRLEGNPFFKEHLSYYLNLTRGFHISKDHLMTAGSRQVLLYILTQLLIKSGDVILVGEYSYPFSNMVFQQAGVKIKTLPMDREGIQVDYLRKHFNPGDLKLLYLQPQHQYPTTCCLSEKRRQELVALAREYNFILLEDDTDYELTYEKSISMPLVKMSPSANVIYMGRFGQFLTPGFQTDFMIAPKDFIEEAHKYLNIFGRRDVVKEQALGEIINDGDIHRYRRKATKMYQTRRDTFEQLLPHYFPDIFVFDRPKGGLAFWLELPPSFSLSNLSKACQQQQLSLPSSCLFQNRQKAALRLGFAHLNTLEMEQTIKTFRKAWDSMDH